MLPLDFPPDSVHCVNMSPAIEARLRAASPSERNAAIVDARNEGATIRQIATAVGLSIGGVHKILNPKEDPK